MHNLLIRIITVNPVGYLLGSVNVNYEQVQNNCQSFVVSVVYYSYSSGTDWKISGLGGRVGIRMYHESTAPEGLYYGPLGSVSSLSTEYGSSTGSNLILGVGGVVGYQWITDNNIVLNAEAGLNYMIGSITVDGETAPTEGISPMVGLSVGTTF